MVGHPAKTWVLATVIMWTAIVTAAGAANVTLRSFDGAVSLSGELAEFDGTTYVLKSVIGDIRIDADDVECIGQDCPDLSTARKDFTVMLGAGISKALLPRLLTDFGANVGLQAQYDPALGVKMINSAGAPVAHVSIGYSAGDAGFGNITSAGQQITLAMDGLVILVSQRNPVSTLSLKQIGAIFSGEITNWSMVGGADAVINVYRQNVAASDSEFFRSVVLANTGGRFTQTASIVSSNGDISRSVDSDINGIGFAAFGNRGDAKDITISGSCGLLSAATEFAIKTEEYPLARRLSAYTADREMSEIAGGFTTYLDTASAQNVVAQEGYVSMEIATEYTDQQGLRFANTILVNNNEVGLGDLRDMTAFLVGAERVSTTFRFVKGSSTLDARAQRDIVRLLEWFAGQNMVNKEILLIGFTDSVGKSNVNTVLAEQRARQVLETITAVAPEDVLEGLHIKTVGLGEVSPMACSDAPNGRFINRRVEVWVRSNN